MAAAQWVETTAIDLVLKGTERPHSGPWDSALRLRVTTARPVRPPGFAGDQAVFPVVDRPFLAIAGDGRFSGLWSVERAAGSVLWCVVSPSHYEEGTPRLRAPAFDLDVTADQPNLRAVHAGPSASRKAWARFAPPLELHVRSTIFMIDAIDTVNQTYRGDVQVELRARGILSEDLPDLGLALCAAYGLKESMVNFLNVTERLNDMERWTATGNNVHKADIVDFSYTLRLQGVFIEEYEIRDFPFDEQEITVKLTVHLPTTRVRLVGNPEFPSKFVDSNFQLGSVFKVVLGSHVEASFHESDVRSSSAGRSYPQCHMRVFLRRKPAYFVNQVVLPLAAVTLIAPLSIATEADGAAMGTGDRLAYAVTILLTSVAYRFVIAGSIPQVSYLTAVDGYNLVCFIFMLVNVMEAALWPTVLGQRSLDALAAGEPNPEWWWALAFLGAFLVYNVCFWVAVIVQITLRGRKRAAQLARLDAKQPHGSSSASTLASGLKSSSSVSVVPTKSQ